MANQRYLSTQNETLIVRFLVIVTAYFLLRGIIRRNAQLAQQDQVIKGDDISLLAVQIRQALNPSGITWIMDVDGTDEPLLYDAAKKITDLSKVSTAYKNLYNSDLITDLQNELDNTQLVQFQNFIGKGGAVPKRFARVKTNAFRVIGWNGTAWDIDRTVIVRTYEPGELIADGDSGQNIEPDGSIYLIFEVQKWFGLTTEKIAVLKANTLTK